MDQPVVAFWFRRDLRLEDNAGLYHALRSGLPVLPVFIFDTVILDALAKPLDARVTFIHETITELQHLLRVLGSDLLVLHGNPVQLWPQLITRFNIKTVYTNHDFEPYAIERDGKVETILANRKIQLKTYKDHVIFEKREIAKDDGQPYTVFTPYSKKWKARLASKMGQSITSDGFKKNLSFYLEPYPCAQYFPNFFQTQSIFEIPSLREMGFEPAKLEIPSAAVSRGVIKNYDKTRDYPAIKGTSRLGIHFRFGTISIREKAYRASQLNETYLNELIWRDFYAQILYNYPYVAKSAFRPEYDYIQWRNDEAEFERWCNGTTGYPIVDAGMRELNATGYMHNRVRMITASFLTKHLLIDWRWGEAYFASRLLDFDLASNNGGWQWAAGCGTDAAPYFRVFNPTAQQEKFDKDFVYIRHWVHEFGTTGYPVPMVDHRFARERCLQVYKEGLAQMKNPT